MFNKGNKLYSIINGKCPRCHEGEVFVNKNPYKKLAFRKTHIRCAACGQAYEPEPGFFQGAMYVSYGLSVGLAFIIGGALLFTTLSAEVILIIFSIILLLLLPVIFRTSRLIWMNMFIHYNPAATIQTGQTGKDRR